MSISFEKLEQIKEFFPLYNTDDLEEVQILLNNIYLVWTGDLTEDQNKFVKEEINDFCDLMNIKGDKERNKVKVFIYSIL